MVLKTYLSFMLFVTVSGISVHVTASIVSLICIFYTTLVSYVRKYVITFNIQCKIINNFEHYLISLKLSKNIEEKS